MRFIKKRQKEYDAPIVQTAQGVAKENHPFSILNRYAPLSTVELKLYEALREAIPIIDAAIYKTIRLIGNFNVLCSNPIIQKQLNSFLSQIKCGAGNTGIESFVCSYLEQLLTYGTAIGEVVPNSAGNDIYALYIPPLEDVELKVNGNPLNVQVCKKEISGKSIPVNCQDLILLSALSPSPGSIYGNSILKGLPFVSKILLNIYQSINMNWDRVGNVRFAVTYKPNSDSMDKSYAKDRAMQISKEWSRAMQSGSGVNDFIAVGDVDIKVIGADNQILDSEIPVRQLLEQIVSKLSIPPFLLGLSWSTTERMSSQQVDILTSELEFYRRLLNPILTKICNIWMMLTGNFANIEIVWDNINLQDEVQLANARLMEAKAKEIEKKLENNNLINQATSQHSK